MKKNNIFSAILTMCLMLTGAVSFTACSNNDLDTNQFTSGVSLNVYGPTPVMRGGTLRFIGSNLDQISQVEIPGVAPITNIEVVKSGVPSEIRVVVPHDGPKPGLVKLTTKSGDVITTITELNYTEGLNPANITMTASAMPGDKIRLSVPESGDDYLDIIHMIEFAGGAQVGENDFTAHTRYLIELVVPQTAQTGKLDLYTADLTAADVDESSVEYQIISTEKAIEIGVPSVSKVASPRGEAAAQGTVTAKAGETITITGTYFNLVQAVNFNAVKVSEFKSDGKTITVALPAAAADGAISFTTLSGVVVPVGSFVSVKPTEAVVAPNPVKAGAELTITGKDLDIITSVEFPNAAAQDGDNITVSADKIVVKAVPEKATEGSITLRMANGAGVEVPYTLVKPVIASYSVNPANAGSPLQITGTDLDLVKNIDFGGAQNEADKFAVNADGTVITVTVPMAGKSGKPLFNLANGTSVEGEELTINEAVFCYFTEMPAEDAELKAGDSFVLPVANGDKLTGVEINGEACQYVLTGNNQLIIGVPAKAKKGAQVRLISSNGEITYTMDFIPNTEVTTVLWTGQAVADDWANQPYVLSDGGQELKDAGVVPGDIISFHITPLESEWKIQFVEGHWGPTYASICNVGNSNTEDGKFTEYDLDANKGYFNLEVTQEMLDAAYSFGGWGGVFVLNGDNIVVDKITTTHFESVEETLWEGEAVADDWGNQPYVLSDGGAELAAVDAKVGQTIYFYFTPLDAAWKVEIVEGHWGPTYKSICSVGNDTESGKFTEFDLAGNGGKYGLTITQEMLSAAYSAGGWGGVFVLNGDNIKCTKITIE